MFELLPLFIAIVGGMIVFAACGLSVLAKRLILRLARGAGSPVRWGPLWIASLCEIPIIIFVFIVAWCAIPSDPQILRERPGLFCTALFGSIIVLHALFALFPNMSLLKKIGAAAGQDAAGENSLWLAFLLGLPMPLLASALALALVSVLDAGSPLPFMYATY